MFMMLLYEEIEKCFPKIEERFSNEELISFGNAPDEDLCLYHFGLGIWIRTHLLVETGELFHMFLSCGIAHKDDMSAIIIKMFNQSLK